jgi:Family of unknown function (DUF6176)
MPHEGAPRRLRIELTRFRARPDTLSLIDEWMDMLNARMAEALATFPRERMHVEAIFRDQGQDPEYVYWFSIQEDGGEPVETSHASLDRDHLAYWDRCISDGPGENLTLAVTMIPDALRSILSATYPDASMSDDRTA